MEVNYLFEYMATLKDLELQFIAFRDERDWEQFHNPKDVAISISLEAAEVLDHFLWKNEKEVAEHMVSHKEEIAEELSDVVNNVLLLAHGIGIDLEAAMAKKLQKNRVKYPVEKSRGNHTKYNQLN